MLLGVGTARSRAVLEAFVHAPGIVVYAAATDRRHIESARAALGTGPHLVGVVSLRNEMTLRRVLAAADALVDLTRGAQCALVIDACVLERVAYLDATGTAAATGELTSRARVVELRDMVAVPGLDPAHADDVVAVTMRALQRRLADGSPIDPGLHEAPKLRDMGRGS